MQNKYHDIIKSDNNKNKVVTKVYVYLIIR